MFKLKERLEDWLEARSARSICYAGACRRAGRGALYLDRKEPGWHRRIDPARLEVGRGSSCILGQLHGSFLIGLAHVELIGLEGGSKPSPVDLGFLCVRGVSDTLREQDYEYLNQAWQEEIAARLAWEQEALGHLLSLAESVMTQPPAAVPA